MGLSRLDNFLKNTRGNILYVSPHDIDATDSIDNQGNSLARPFRTIQRALIESARFSYQKGIDNDRFAKTTILLYPGDHIVDNRPGLIPEGSNNFINRDGTLTNNFPPFDSTTNFDLTSPNNQLYKFNSVHGGVIVPRGTSIVGYDLRKTKIRPLYVPSPTNDQIERSAVFRVTGACYFWQFTLFDADPNGQAYIDYTTNQFVPNFSHHKLTCFEYADGKNGVTIDDDFQTYKSDRTDLDMYYEKIGLAYGQASGRDISPDYPSASVDIQTNINEFRIVGSIGEEVGISSIRAGDGIISTPTITVTTDTDLSGVDVDTPIRIQGVNATGYDGPFVISEVISSTEVKYQVQNPPSDPLPGVAGAKLNIQSDTVTSASPYIFNISLRSVFGMNGLLADGSKADGFKSMMVAQFTGISLQKDNAAFLKYDTETGTYKDENASGNENLSTDPLSKYKPAYENYHIHVANDGYAQAVSCFAIGYAAHFKTSSGGDLSITNSNSNFGGRALEATGFKRDAFAQDDKGYISHIIPPKELEKEPVTLEYGALDVSKIADVSVGVATTSALYLYQETIESSLPSYISQGYRIGAKNLDTLNVILSDGSGITTEYSARIVMPPTQATADEVSSKKQYSVQRSAVGINSINSSVISLDTNHKLLNGESVRILSDTGEIPDGLEHDVVYFAITDTSFSGITSAHQLKLARTLNDAISNSPITINSRGGSLTVESRVSDKKSGDLGHPVQYDEVNSNWYVQVSAAATENNIHSTIVGLGTTALGDATPRTFLKRDADNRNLLDTIFRLRYVIPQDVDGIARPPIDGNVLQESGGTIAATNAEVAKYFSPTTATLSNTGELKNFRIISDAFWNSNIANIETELPHDLQVGTEVELINIKSTGNTVGAAETGFNGFFTVVGISSTKQFSVGLTTDPGTFTNDIDSRDTSLPHFSRKAYAGTYGVYQTRTLQDYEKDKSDGIYQLLITNSSNAPTVTPYTDRRYNQPITDFYPRRDRDNPVSEAQATKTFALPDSIGVTVVNDPEKSITKESLNDGLKDFNIGIGITDFFDSSAVGTAVTFFTEHDHGLNRATKVSISVAGQGYGNGVAGTLYGAKLVGAATSTCGKHATAAITVNSVGAITKVILIDGGSAYGIGNTMYVAGTATTTGFTQAVVKVDEIYDNVGSSVGLDILPKPYQNFNSFYRITGVEIGEDKKFTTGASVPIAGIEHDHESSTITGVGNTIASQATLIVTGKTVDIGSFSYDQTTGIGTVTTTGAHGYNPTDKFVISGALDPTTSLPVSLYTGSFIVQDVISLTQFTTKIGVGTTTPAFTGTMMLYRPAFNPTGGNITAENDQTSGRNVPQYAGITTTLSSAVVNRTIDEISITNLDKNNLLIGDYLKVDNEIMRIKETVDTNPVKVFRGVLGTIRQTHLNGSVIRRIKPRPIEFRRNSLMRASGHTFEYTGYGPGNYSTSLPRRQTIDLSVRDRLNTISARDNGGVVNFTGMDDEGNFYIGNKKTSSSTGQVDSFDIPVPTTTGGASKQFSAEEGGFDIIDPLQANIRRGITVEGGTDGDALSKFDGPVIFNNKLTSTSPEGIEATNVLIQGDAKISRKFTVGLGTPTESGNSGDIVFRANPGDGEYVGWVYTTKNNWKKFGTISPTGRDGFAFNEIGVSTESGAISVGNTVLNFVGSGLSITSVSDITSGINTVTFTATNPETPANLNVSGITTLSGETNFDGATSITGVVTFSGNIPVTVNSGAAFTGGLNTNQLNVIGIATFGTIGTTNFGGSVSIGNSSDVTDRTITVLSGDNNNAGFEAMGNNDGRGYIYLSGGGINTSNTRGGGISFPGNLTPTFATGEVSENINFYRKDAGVNEVLFSYPYDKNEVTFRSSITINSDINVTGIATAGISTATSLFTRDAEVVGVATVGIVTATNSFATNISASNNVTVGNDIVDSKGQTGISSAVLTSTSDGVQWASIGAILGSNVTISNQTSSKNGNGTTYVNTGDSMIFVSATIRVNSWGYYIVAEVDGNEVALSRDNGSAAAGNVWLNIQFFVPRGSSYKIESYNQNDVEQTDSTTKSWVEYTFG